MPVTRAQRDIPLTLTADALNNNIVSAYDWAGGDGTSHVGTYPLTKVGTIPVVDTSVGTSSGRDCSNGRVQSNGYYHCPDVSGIGMASVGTGDFTLWFRIRVPSVAADTTTNRLLFRFSNQSAAIFSIYLYEVAASNTYRYNINGSGTILTQSEATGIPPNTVVDLHVVRTSGNCRVFIDGTFIKQAADTSNWTDAGTGSTNTYFGNVGNTEDHILIDTIFWARALSDTEVDNHQANPYSYYENSAPANAIVVNSPTDGSTVGTNIPISGTYEGSDNPTSIEASFNGGAYQTITASPSGGTFSGTLNGQTPATGTLTVRWTNITSVLDTVTSLTVADNSIALTSPVDYRMYQRNGSDQASVTVAGTYTGAPTQIEYRWDGGTWATLVASPSGGTFSQAVTLQGPGQGALEVRFSNATSVTDSSTYIGVGDIYIVVGQSNHSGRSVSSFVTPVAPPAHATWKATTYQNNSTWVEHTESGGSPWDNPTGATYPVSNSETNYGSYFGQLATLLMSRGVPVSFMPNALGSTSVNGWLPGTPVTNTSTLFGSALTRANEVGNHRALLYWQGETEAAGSMDQATYEGHLNDIVDTWFAETGKPTILCNLCAAGNGSNLGVIRAAILNVAATNANVAAIADMLDAFTGDIHYDTVADIETVAGRVHAVVAPVYYGEMAPTRGQATASGLQAAVGVPVTVDGLVGTATASGLQATISTDITTIDGLVGTATASGLQATIIAEIVINGLVGTGVASGLQAIIGAGVVIDGLVGTAIASGLQAVVQNDSVTIDAQCGSAVASGLQATIVVSTVIGALAATVRVYPMSGKLCQGNDNVIELSGVREALTGSYLNDATVTASLTGLDGTLIAALTAERIIGLNGVYRCIIEDTVALTDGRRYIVVMDVDGDGLQGHWELILTAVTRRT